MSDSEGLNSEGSNGADQHRRIRDQSLLCTCRACICCVSRKRRRRRTHPMFFSDVSCASYSRCTLDSSSSPVARAAMSKNRSISVSSWDPPVRIRPEMHRRCPPFELFFDERSRKKQRNSTLNTDRKNGFVRTFLAKTEPEKATRLLEGKGSHLV